MKQLILLFVLILISLSNVYSNDCFDGDTIHLYSQNDIYQFALDYPHCTKLDASIIIDPINGEINSLEPLSNLSSLSGVLIVKNTNLIRLSGLHNITSIGFGLAIINNNSLIGLTGLEGLNNIGRVSNSHFDEVGYLHIKSNNSLINLWGIQNLDSLSGDLEITDNPNLEALQGLESLRSINGFKFTGEKIEESKLTISNNPKLSACAVIGICFLRNYAEFDFNNNSKNCNSVVEVMSGCNFISVEEESLNGFKVYPNPSSGIINITSENSITDIKLIDNLGRTIIEKQLQDIKQFDISNEPSGIYFLFINNQMIKILKR